MRPLFVGAKLKFSYLPAGDVVSTTTQNVEFMNCWLGTANIFLVFLSTTDRLFQITGEAAKDCRFLGTAGDVVSRLGILDALRS